MLLRVAYLVTLKRTHFKVLIIGILGRTKRDQKIVFHYEQYFGSGVSELWLIWGSLGLIFENYFCSGIALLIFQSEFIIMMKSLYISATFDFLGLFYCLVFVTLIIVTDHAFYVQYNARINTRVIQIILSLLL